ncbi:hypothetical protein KNP414_05401 [Paenibacillus mucilaginosus KNP414]|uniref:Uncharacterized protein n=1 Tax=Paenibacillus mucilaginosus (strain KNP414) TaxID=1036673 RepID=F8FGA5_PAEMK|nr:hypothetical protein KNP414_05401 [Paenibacillus mucilaginosus KNP414]
MIFRLKCGVLAREAGSYNRSGGRKRGGPDRINRNSAQEE